MDKDAGVTDETAPSPKRGNRGLVIVLLVVLLLGLAGWRGWAAWQARDHMPAFAAYLRDEEVANAEELLAIEAGVEQLIADAIAFADASPAPEPQDLYHDVYAGD